MNGIRLILLMTVFGALTAFCGCRQKNWEPTILPPPKIEVPQQLQTTTQEPPQEKLDTLALPKLFVKMKESKWVTQYAEVAVASGGRSELFAYEKYDVMTTPIKGVAGDRIDVFKRINFEGDTVVVSLRDSIILTVGAMGTWFERLIGDYLLINISTGPGPAGLDIYNLVTSERTCQESYEDSQTMWDGYFLSYWEPVDSTVTKDNCPQLAEWTAQGLSAGIEERITLDVRSCTKKRLGQFRCVPYQ